MDSQKISYNAQELIAKFQIHQKDTGSPEVQVALLTTRIKSLEGHFITHKKDNHSQRGLAQMVNRRRKLLDYLKKKDLNRYKTLIAELKIRK